MTRDEMKRLLDNPVMRAWADGGTLQFEAVCNWVDMEEPLITTVMKYPESYRIKPEPKYRPWTPEEAVKHLGKWVHRSNGEQMIKAIHEDKVAFYDGGHCIYRDLLAAYLTEDGKPCGTEVVDAG